MFPNIPLTMLSNTTQRILTQSNNIAYGTRGVVRVREVQPERKMDYFFRDFYMVLATAYLGEMGFRAVDLLYNIPHMTRALQLHKLSERYPGALNYSRMPDFVRARLMGSLVKSSSNYAVPKVLEEIKEKSGQTLTEAEHKQLDILLRHLHKHLNFEEFVSETLVKQKELTTEEAGLVTKAVKAMTTHVDEAAKKQGVMKEVGEEFRQVLANLLKEHADDPALKALESAAAKEKLMNLVKEGLESHTTMNIIRRIQRSGTWPKMFSSVILNLIFYGFMANFFDVKILQPWQKKIVKERGTSEELVKPGYQALLPGLLVLIVGLYDKFPTPFRKMGYFSRFAAVGGLALATYTATMLYLIKRVLATPPKKAPKPQTDATAAEKAPIPRLPQATTLPRAAETPHAQREVLPPRPTVSQPIPTQTPPQPVWQSQATPLPVTAPMLPNAPFSGPLPTMPAQSWVPQPITFPTTQPFVPPRQF